MPADGTRDMGLMLEPAALDRLMPLHLRIGARGDIRGVGPTLAKLFPDGPPIGRDMLDVFALHRPRGVAGPADLPALEGARLKLALKAPPHTAFKGLAVPIGGGQGWLIDLSFGIGVAEAVREHRLTDADFSATDLTVEMLYLVEAKSAVLDELRRLNMRLQNARVAAEEQALTDTLTGLRNRRAMDLALARASATGAPFGLMQIDLDFFKQVNDTLGHAAGDHVLAHVAQILREEVRAGDTVARVGGDEFVLLFPGLRAPELLEAIGRRILARIEQPILFEGQPCRISASIGTVHCPEGSCSDPGRLLGDADRALYASKRAGRGRIMHAQADAPAPRPAAAGG